MDARRALQLLEQVTKKRKSIPLSMLAAHLKGPLEPIFIGLLTVPFLFFIVIPGISLILALVITINGVRIAEQKHVYIPKFLGKIKISSSLLQKAIRGIRKYFLPQSHTAKRTKATYSPLFLSWLSGWIICFSGILLMLPLPPGATIPPAIALVLVAVGLYRQALGWILSGGLVFILSMGALVLFLGWSAEKLYQDWPQWRQHF